MQVTVNYSQRTPDVKVDQMTLNHSHLCAKDLIRKIKTMELHEVIEVIACVSSDSSRFERLLNNVVWEDEMYVTIEKHLFIDQQLLFVLHRQREQLLAEFNKPVQQHRPAQGDPSLSDYGSYFEASPSPPLLVPTVLPAAPDESTEDSVHSEVLEGSPLLSIEDPFAGSQNNTPVLTPITPIDSP